MGVTAFVARRATDYRDPHSIASRIRRRRIDPLLHLIDAASRRRGHARVLDLGGTEEYWSLLPDGFLESRRVEITVLNVPGAVAPIAGESFRVVEGDACHLPQYADDAFDVVHSNSVLEHVGDWARMEAFAREVRRLAPSYFVQTPNFWFPVEPHWMAPVFHWLPRPVRVGMFLRFQLGHARRAETVAEAVRLVEHARLLDRRMFRALFPDAEHVTERVIGLPKSLIAMRERGKP
jgi:hypothetical protein